MLTVMLNSNSTLSLVRWQKVYEIQMVRTVEPRKVPEVTGGGPREISLEKALKI